MIPLDAIRAARQRIADAAIRTPLVRLEVDAPCEIWLKLENLQPIGSFKLRGAANRMLSAPRNELARGVWTASAGNMAQGVAYMARQLGIACSVVIPDTAPQAKRAAIERLGGRLVPVPFAEWFETFRTRKRAGIEGLFIHAFSDDAVMAGNGSRSSRISTASTRSSLRSAAAGSRAASRPRSASSVRGRVSTLRRSTRLRPLPPRSRRARR